MGPFVVTVFHLSSVTEVMQPLNVASSGFLLQHATLIASLKEVVCLILLKARTKVTQDSKRLAATSLLPKCLSPLVEKAGSMESMKMQSFCSLVMGLAGAL